jgi:hypothetical protein
MRSFDWSAATRILWKFSTNLSTYAQALATAGTPVKSTFFDPRSGAVHNRFRAGKLPDGGLLRVCDVRAFHNFKHRCGQNGNASQKSGE